MTDLRQGRDALPHDDGLLFAIEDLLDGNGVSCTSVNNAFIIFHWGEDVPLVKYRTKFTDEVVDFRLLIRIKVRYINLSPQDVLVLLRDEGVVEAWIDGAIEVRHRVTKFP